MSTRNSTLCRTSAILLCLSLSAGGRLAAAPEAILRSPREIVAAPDGTALYLVEATAHRIAVFDPAVGEVARHLPLPAPPGGLAISPDGGTLYVTRATPDGAVWFVDATTGTIGKTVPVGHTPVAATVSGDGRTLFVCNQFDHDLSVVDLDAVRETTRIPVRREPVASALTTDGRQLIVANLLPTGPANDPHSSAEVSLIHVADGTCLKHVPLPNGSHSIQGVCVSPDGRFAYLTHILSRYQIPTTQLERGWMNTNALSILDLAQGTLYTTVLLDDVDRGAANPWGLAVSPDGRLLCVTHAGTHELSIIQREQLHEKLEQLQRGEASKSAALTFEDVPNDLAFLTGLRKRIPLQDRGPRGIAVLGDTAYVTGYYSDTVSMVSLAENSATPVRVASLGPTPAPDPVRRGEFFFHDASRCFQQWQSCVSCHPGVRSDALNWDLLNDDIGNPKNTKSLLLSHQTPPAMISGVRDQAETAVRAGIRYIEFAVWPEEDAAAVDAYLSSLTPVPSPFLEQGKLSASARRGEAVFDQVGCSECHPAPLYTDLKQHDLGTGSGRDEGRAWDTPTLVESWRTAPYFYDGRSPTMADLFQRQKHGLSVELPPDDMDDLIEYVQSL